MEQLGFEGMPRRLYTCTPTRLSSWLDCPRRYRMSYLDRPSPPKGPPWAHNSVGASVHNALAGWWRLPLAQRTVAAAGNLVDRGWINEGFADETQSVRQRERAIAMVEGYVAGLDPADEPLVVVDYKTGRHLLTTDDVRSSMALALYALATARVMRRDCHRVELHHLPTGEVLAWSHTTESLARHLRRAEDIAEEAAAADERMRDGLPADAYDEVFPPRPGPSCAWCDYRRHRPEGPEAAPPPPPPGAPPPPPTPPPPPPP